MTAPAAIILNTSSGVDNSHGSLPGLLRKNGIDGEIVIAARGVDITALARQLLQSGRRTLVAAGGDGTVSAVATAMAGTEATLGVLPLGTLNHFAKDLKVPLDIEGAVKNLSTGVAHIVDVAGVDPVHQGARERVFHSINDPDVFHGIYKPIRSRVGH